MKRVLWILLTVLIASSLTVGIYYQIDRSKRFDALRSGGTAIEASKGLIEYELVGEAEVNSAITGFLTNLVD